MQHDSESRCRECNSHQNERRPQQVEQRGCQCDPAARGVEASKTKKGTAAAVSGANGMSR